MIPMAKGEETISAPCPYCRCYNSFYKTPGAEENGYKRWCKKCFRMMFIVIKEGGAE